MNILLVGSRGNDNSSKLLLDLIMPRYYIDKLYLPGDLAQSKEQLIEHMRHKTYNYVFIFAMNDNADEENVQIDLLAKEDEKEYRTNYDFESLNEYLTEQKIRVTISNEPASDFTNALYTTSLRQIYENKESTKSILLNIPSVSHIDIMKLSYLIIKYFSDILEVH